MKTAVTLMILLAALALTPGCIAIGKSPVTSLPTLGKELEELKDAYDTGAITQEEWEKAKKTLLQNASKR